jgi:energy-converting hydrogenase Eha subunit B
MYIGFDEEPGAKGRDQLERKLRDDRPGWLQGLFLSPLIVCWAACIMEIAGAAKQFHTSVG